MHSSASNVTGDSTHGGAGRLLVSATRNLGARNGACEHALTIQRPIRVLVPLGCEQVIPLVSTALRHAIVDLLRAGGALTGIDPMVRVDLAVVDLEAAGDSRQPVLEAIRLYWPASFVICVNVDSERRGIQYLHRGADIALCRGRSPTFVCGVIRAAARRVDYEATTPRTSFGDVVLDRDARRVWCSGVLIALTEREFQLLRYLLLRAGQIVPYRELASHAWRVNPTIDTNGIAVYVGYLRRKLEASQLTTLVTARGQGYGLFIRVGAARSRSIKVQPSAG